MAQLEMGVRVDKAGQQRDVAEIFERHARAMRADRDDALIVELDPPAVDRRTIDWQEPLRSTDARHRKTRKWIARTTRKPT